MVGRRIEICGSHVGDLCRGGRVDVREQFHSYLERGYSNLWIVGQRHLALFLWMGKLF